MSKKLKVFHGMVNYGTQASLFAEELRKNGIDAISVVGYDNFKRGSDVQFYYSKKRTIRIPQRIINGFRKLYWFFKYNTFHFYFGRTLFSKQRDLPFYRLFGKKVIFEYLGNDIRHYKSLVQRYNLPEDHDFYIRMDIHDDKVHQRVHYEKKYIDYLVCCLPTHVDFAKEYNIEINEILPLALDLSRFEYSRLQLKSNDIPLQILHAPTKRDFKGTAYIEEAIKVLSQEDLNFNFKIIEGVSHLELMDEIRKADIFIDQISVGWYGTVTLEAMAAGRPTCAFIDDRYFQYIDYSDEIPVININRDNIADVLRKLIMEREKLPSIGMQSRKFVEKHHDIKIIVRQLINIYQYKLWNDYENKLNGL